MKYAIISDIHGNTNAFKAALLDAKNRGCGKVVCLGDLTGYGDDSLGCVKLAMARLDVCLMAFLNSILVLVDPSLSKTNTSSFITKVVVVPSIPDISDSSYTALNSLSPK